MVRLIVTGSLEGRPIFLRDGSPPWTAEFEATPGFEVSLLWSTNSHALNELTDEEPPSSWVPGNGGSRLIVATFPPECVLRSEDFDGLAAHAEQLEKLSGLAECFDPDHPGMHTTPTLDYGVVLSGEISLDLDGGQIKHLKPHDVVVQRGTRHAWRNLSSSPSTVLFALFGALKR